MRFLKIILIVIIALSLSYCSEKSDTHSGLEVRKEELLKTIEKFNKAFQEGNIAVLESMITENYLHTNGSSKAIGKDDWFDYLNRRENEIKSGDLEVIEYKMDEMEVEFYGNVAIVTAKVLVENKESEGIRKNEYRVTNLWVNETGTWKRAGFHDGRIQ